MLNFFSTHECTTACQGLRAPAFATSGDLKARRHRIELQEDDAGPFGSRHR